jgi:hypothetical protein
MLGALVAAGAAHAQQTVVVQESRPPAEAPYRDDLGVVGPIVFNVGGTLGIPVGNTEEIYDLGGGLSAGITFNPHPMFGVQLQYTGNWSSLKTSTTAQNFGIFGNAAVDMFNANIVLRPFHKDRFGVYIIAGGGYYYRSVTINQVTGTAIAPICDPYFFYCSAAAVPVGQIIGSRNRWDWGVDGGLGFTIALARYTRLYLEARYHYIFGPTYTDITGTQHTANGQFVPVTIGVEF